MAQGISDSIIVVIKLEAEEDTVMYLRTKLLEIDNKSGRRIEHVNKETLTLRTVDQRFKEKKIPNLRRIDVPIPIRRGIEDGSTQTEVK